MDWLVELLAGLLEGLVDAWPWGDGGRRRRRRGGRR